ncbi:ImmA/IrrE family metallo-endopeptidase [Kribbella sp. NPDC058245]|uniref:ImmA/IrrE family metallo-endopeptidase n=1 Tax=Kribbella sp. NPDC058245 TaxID=3346399 RepID=UPI0036EEA165
MSAVEVMYALAKVAGELGYGVRWGESTEGFVSRADRRRRQIVLSPSLDPHGAAGRIAHELAHLRMHKLSSGSRCHGLMELEAESVAYAVLARYGCVVDRRTAERLSAVASVVGHRPPARMVDALGGRVVTVAGRLAGAAERHLESRAAPVHVRPTRVDVGVQGTSPEEGPGLSL